jgi:hypothetical protein
MTLRSLSYFAILAAAAAVGAGCATPPVTRGAPGGGGGGGGGKGTERCGKDDNACADPPPPADSPELVAETRSILVKACAPCHSGRGDITPRGGFGTIFEVEDMVRDGLVVPNDPDASRLYQKIDKDEMPEDGAFDPLKPQTKIEKLTADEKATIKAWIAAGAPTLRDEERAPIFSGELLQLLRADLNTVNPADVGNIRYISLHTYYNNKNVPRAELDAALNAVSKLLNHLTTEQRSTRPPQLVLKGQDPIAVRVRLGDYDLEPADWQRIEDATDLIDRRADPCDVGMVNADQFLAIASTDEHERLDGAVESVYSNIVTRKLLRGKNILQGDQLVFERALGNDGSRAVQFLVSQFTLLDIAAALGIDLKQSLDDPDRDRAIRACTRKSGVSQAIRCIQRDAVADARRGLWWSMDFINKEGADGLADPFITPIGPSIITQDIAQFNGEDQFKIAGGEAIWNWPNSMAGYALYNGELKLISAAPQDAVSHPKNEENAFAVENAVSCFDCHTSHMLNMRDDLKPILDAGGDAVNNVERGFVAGLFRGQEELDVQFKQDTDDFMAALNDVYVRKGESGKLPDAIFTLNLGYERDLTMDAVAAELFATPEDIAAQVRRNENLQRLAPALALSDNGFINRQNFIAAFKDLAANVGPNDDVSKFCVQRVAQGLSADQDGGRGGDQGNARAPRAAR